VVERDILISIVIVNYRVHEYLMRTLASLREADLYDRSEVIVVDNASMDASRQNVLARFSEISWIGLKNNIGFGKACNVGAQSARGTYLLLINPDTLVSKNTLKACVDFFVAHPDAGIMGPKIINPDGTLQVSCRRSFPSPAVAFYRLSGLSRLFPKSKRFGRYNLNYLDPETVAEVDAVSGSFMFMPLSLFRECNGFDETFFMYGEDLDLCYRMQERGRKVWYNPSTQIVHFKGRSAAKLAWKARKAFYEAMVIFSRKYEHMHAAFFPTWVMFVGIMLLAGSNFIAGLFKTFTACFIDLLLINQILWAFISIRFAISSLDGPYGGASIITMLIMHAILSISFLVIFFYRGVYTKERYSVGNALISGFIASMIFMVAVFFVKSIAFSRIAFLASALITILVLIGWREVLPKLIHRFKRLIFSTGNVVILGNDDVTMALIRNVEADSSAQISGILWPIKEQHPGDFVGYPVLGHIDKLRDVLSRGRVDLLIIATAQPWYSYVIEALATVKVKHLTIQWVPPELFSDATENLPDVIPLRDFSV
jgi:O-antigen biosynthesis protein